MKFKLPISPEGQKTRCQLHPACDLWMRGDRYGDVVGVSADSIRVLLDKSGKLVTLSRQNVGEIFNSPIV